MNKHQLERYHRLRETLESYGIDQGQLDRLLRIEKTLHRWAELECGDSNDHCSWCIVRDEGTGKTYMETHPNTGKSYRRPIPDRETGALKRLAAILKDTKLTYYHQGDPRGCALYILRPGDVPEGQTADCYHSRGIAICY